MIIRKKTVGDWCWFAVPGGRDLCRIVGFTESGMIAKQFFSETPGCPNKCLEGDGGSAGANMKMLSLVQKVPSYGWCDHCDDYAYGFWDIGGENDEFFE